MKRLFIVLFLIIDTIASAKIYYVSPAGNASDKNSGQDINYPWATWQKAFNSTPAGDTCYFRGGTWYPTSTINWGGNNGTYDAPTCFFNYPGEKPIADFRKMHGSGNKRGLYLYDPAYIHFKGLEICNVWQESDQVVIGLYLYKADGYIKFDQCVSHNMSGRNFFSENCDTVLYYNCDAYNGCDTLTAYDPGGGSSGFSMHNNTLDDPDAPISYVLFKGCRGWNISDQAWGGGSDGLVVRDSCWAIHNGFHWYGVETEASQYDDYGYNGNGMKWGIGWVYDTTKITAIFKNCVFAYNEYIGFSENTSETGHQVECYNNFLYHNGFSHYNNANPLVQNNFYFWGHSAINYNKRLYRNNLSYMAGRSGAEGDYRRKTYENNGSTGFISEGNIWNDDLRITDDDFITLDTTGMCGPRQKDGSLPYTLFGHPKPTSDLVDAGTPKTNLSFKGDGPDVGWVESQPGSNMYPSVVITSPASGSKFTPPANVNIIVNALDGDGTISKVEFFNGTTKLDEKTSNPWSIVWDSIPDGTYSLTAVATDNLGAKTTSSAVSITVGNSTVANKPPAITILNPVTGSSFTAPASITITTNASDTDGTISKVEFFNGSTKLGEKTSNPWSFTWNNVPLGTYTLTAVATDNSNARTTSLAVTIIVNDLPPVINQPPVITISNPAKGTKYEKPADITIDAIASDADGTISKVEFFNGNIKLAEITASPWSFTWKDVNNGTYSLTAVATDNLNATAVSSPVDVAVEDVITSRYDPDSEIINLYPNPNNGIFTIELIDPLQSEKSRITITSYDGKVIYNGTMLQEEISKQIDLSHIYPGFYILILSRNEIIVTKKFIKGK